MEIKTFINQIADENSYLLTSDSGHQLLIDPGSDLDYLLEITDLKAVLLTHAHFDHILGLNILLEKYPQLAVYLDKAEKEWMTNPLLNYSKQMLGEDFTTKEATDYYTLNQTINLADFNFSVRATPGHSIG
ncbi:MAG: MBL fold metallo-hydrolase, partial [Lactovum sp.]